MMDAVCHNISHTSRNAQAHELSYRMWSCRIGGQECNPDVGAQVLDHDRMETHRVVEKVLGRQVAHKVGI